MAKIRWRLSLLALLALTLGTALPAAAGDKEKAKKLFESGLKLMKLDDYAAAAANFERSTALFPTQTSLFNLANCYHALRRYGDALDTLARLQRDFATKLKPEIRAAAAQQEQEIRALVARLTIEVMPARAAVSIDGKGVGTGPTLGPLLLGPGEHTIEATHPGYRLQRRSVQLVSGAHTTERLELVAEVVGVPAAAPYQVAPAGAPMLATAPPPLGAAPAPYLWAANQPKPRSGALRVVAWSSLAGAAAAGAAAGIFTIIGYGNASEFDKYNGPGGTVDPQKRDSAKSAAELDRNLAIGCGIVAAALAVTAGITYWAGRDAQQPSGNSTKVSVSPFGLSATF